jgi:PAS domain S-box-containing protein
LPGPTSTITASIEGLDLASVIRVSQAVSSEIAMEKLIETLLRTAVEHAGADRGLLIEARGGELSIRAEANTRGAAVIVGLRDLPISAAELPESVVRYAARTDESVILDDATGSNSFSDDEYIRERRPRSVLCLPLVKRGVLVALLYLENNLSPNVFTPGRIAVLKVLASQAAISLDNSRLYGDLQKREAEVRRLVDANIVGIFIWELEGRILEANDAFLRIVGYEREDLLSGRLRWTDLTPAEWLGRDLEQFVPQLKLTGSLQPFEKEYFRKDGSRVPVLLGAAAFDEECRRGVAFVVDLTERKRAEKELRASERKYRHLVDTTPTFIHTALPNGDADFYNRGWLEYAGLPLTDLLGWGWTCMIHPEDVETFVPKWRAALEAGEPFVAEARVRRADGEYRWFLHREEPLRNEAGEIVKWYGSSIEIEERKQVEEIRIAQARQAGVRADVSAALSKPTHLGEILRGCTEAIVRHLDAAFARIWMLNKDESMLELQASAGMYTRLDGSYSRIPVGDLKVGCIAREKKAHLTNDVMNDPRVDDKGWAQHNGMVAFAGYPLVVEDRLIGVVAMFSRYPLSDDTLDTLGSVADAIAQGIERKRVEVDLEAAFKQIQVLKDQLYKENIALREEIDKTSMFEEIVGKSPPLKDVLTRVSKVAPTDSTVLITGETGTGKELIARAIHKRSGRASRVFVSVNCAAIPPALVASELFGHEKGAFTGALQRRIGRFELAEGGTIFLDEVGELPAETQIALLRVLQEREFERVGGGRPVRADIRLIAATNRDLKAAIGSGSFRSDLFYRLNVFPIEMPSLRFRREDIPLLAEYFIHRYAGKMGKKISRISRESLQMLQCYTWPGNIRELQNVIERSVIVCETETLTVDESWFAGQTLESSSSTQPLLKRPSADEEKTTIEAALTEARGRVSGPSGAAVKLGIPASTLESKIRALKINKHSFKATRQE